MDLAGTRDSRKRKYVQKVIVSNNFIHVVVHSGKTNPTEVPREGTRLSLLFWAIGRDLKVVAIETVFFRIVGY